jgi:hypothetical protein
LESQELKPSNNNSSQFNLSLSDRDGDYKYEGIRTSVDSQYVLIFDPVEKHFVLHQLDSTFDMDITSTPWEQDRNTLANSYDQLNASSGKPRRKSTTQAKAAAKPQEKQTKVQKPKPKPKKKPPPREPTPDAEDEDSDDGLTIEYPGGPPPPRFQPPPAYNRDSSVESDVDAEYEEDDMEKNQDVEVLELSSPVRQQNDDMDIDDDLERDLQAALELELDVKDDSSESEEE